MGQADLCNMSYSCSIVVNCWEFGGQTNFQFFKPFLNISSTVAELVVLLKEATAIREYHCKELYDNRGMLNPSVPHAELTQSITLHPSFIPQCILMPYLP